MINSMDLLLSTAARVSSLEGNSYSVHEANENGFESALQKELGLSSENDEISAEELNLEKALASTESDLVDDEDLAENVIASDNATIIDQLMMLNVNSQQLNTALISDKETAEQSKNASPEFVDTVTSLGEFVVLKDNASIAATDQKPENNELTNSVNSDNNNVFDGNDVKDLIFKSKLQRLYDNSVKVDAKSKMAPPSTNDSDSFHLRAFSVQDKLQAQVKSESLGLKDAGTTKDSMDFKDNSTAKTISNLGNTITSVSEIGSMVDFETELVTEQQTVELNSSAQAKESDSIINQMTKSITYGKLADGEYMNVKLKPDYLGEMSFNIQKSSAGSILNIQVESDTVKRMLTEKIDELLTVLSDKFITIDKVMVTSDAQSNNNNSQFSQQLSQHEFSNSQSDDSQHQQSRKEYMNLDAIESSSSKELQTLYGLNEAKVSIYV